jgi:hypothetical protein
MLFCATLLVGAACTTTSPGAGPLRYCGKVVSQGGPHPLILDTTRLNGAPTITGTSNGGLVWLQVGEDCDHGGSLSVEPPTAWQVDPLVKSKDGRDFIVTLHPIGSATPTVVVVTRPDGTGATIHIDLPRSTQTN